ncbi:hypothetical protein B0G62_11315 [Paraburkholderia eburnea]|uniref:Uncharacterized protein n=1 Tax=Paraburkholderia eburnea TaxID=1189126 RepID=A0A2S4M200_9BURK|nr:hypothetical protein [Paraburkholderia eburnea]POR48730.1 hypothetical protein B0G62_11315 [Paraburkholderia eburnea]PRZ20845.1 hypothetical protein BX588_11079 [Paraburkholderia eburnea]
MSASQSPILHTALKLHVFEQEGGWHWGITIPRAAGGGFKVIAYSDTTFSGETEARRDGDRVLHAMPDHAAASLVC